MINNNKYTLILEDDVVLEKNFYFHIIHSLKYITNFDILYLGCNLNNKDDAHLVSNNILKVLKPKTHETTALGAALIAALGAGIFKSLSQIAKKNRINKQFRPKMNKKIRLKLLNGWSQAIRKTII